MPIRHRHSDIILLVEDNPDHAEHTEFALRDAGVVNPIIILRNGEQAVKYLRREPPYIDNKQYPLPGLILLDVKLPKVEGFEILKLIKSDSILKIIPVVILTTTNAPNDIERGADLGANDYIVKPVRFNDFLSVVGRLGMYWIHTSELTKKMGES